MSFTRFLAGIVLAGLLASGCAGGPFANFTLFRGAGRPYLEEGIRQYEEGNYRVASRRLQFALEEGLPRPERVTAHKYLAFIACVSGQQLTCREEFAIAFELDSAFALDQAEAGHPIWGPVYKSVKASRK
jgi:Tfp pilus assembly protein PilF